MKLQEKLDAHKNAFVKKVPAEVLAVMQRAKDELADSGIMERTIKVGDPAPDFTLTNTDGKPLALGSLLDKGSVVLGFYRGRW